jgi:hypothetical protein
MSRWGGFRVQGSGFSEDECGMRMKRAVGVIVTFGTVGTAVFAFCKQRDRVSCGANLS